MTETELPSGLPVDQSTQSYWHKEPSKTLLGHRTTPELPATADVVIVGSGITGSFAAHHIREKRPDLSVVMLEAREACWGATGRNGGHCQPIVYSKEPHIASFELRNYSYLKTLVEEFSIPCDWRSTTGVHSFYSAELFDQVQQQVKNLTDNYPDLAANIALVTKGEGGSPSWLLEGERKQLTLDGLRIPTAEGAVVQWHAASLWPYKLVAFVLERLLAAAASSDGNFNLQTKTPVTGVVRDGSAKAGGEEEEEEERWTVKTPRGNIQTSKVLLATNGYTSHLLPTFADLLVPVRGQVSALKPPTSSSSEEEDKQQQQEPPLDIGNTYVFAGVPNDPYDREDYLIQRPPPEAELIFGGGRAHAKGRGVGVWDDSTVDEPVAWYLKGELGEAMDLSKRPAVTDPKAAEVGVVSVEGDMKKEKKQDLEPTHEWTGVMGYSKDGYPWVGAVPESMLSDSATSNITHGVVADGSDQQKQQQQQQQQQKGLWVCAGYTGHGMPNAALSARAVVDMMYGVDKKEKKAVSPTSQPIATATSSEGIVVVDDGGAEGDVEGDDGDDDEAIDIPTEYILTEARIKAARMLESVRTADQKGSLFSSFGEGVHV